MAVNRRYLSSPWRQTSSLYRAAQSAKNLQDEEMKFKWDFEQISNEDYLKYVNKRAKEQTDPSDVMKWARNMRTVEREIRSDMRARDFLRISTMRENNSDKAYSKYAAYVNLANAALEDGDNDAYISAQTAANNAYNSYTSKLDSEARAGSARASKAATKRYQAEEDALRAEEMSIKEKYKNDEFIMGARLATLYAKWAQLKAERSDSDVTENQARDLALAAEKMFNKASDMAEGINGQFVDIYGDPYTGGKDRNGKPQKIAGFDIGNNLDSNGNPIVSAAQGATKFLDTDGTIKKKIGNEIYSVRYDQYGENGQATLERRQATENDSGMQYDPITGEWIETAMFQPKGSQSGYNVNGRMLGKDDMTDSQKKAAQKGDYTYFNTRIGQGIRGETVGENAGLRDYYNKILNDPTGYSEADIARAQQYKQLGTVINRAPTSQSREILARSNEQTLEQRVAKLSGKKINADDLYDYSFTPEGLADLSYGSGARINRSKVLSLGLGPLRIPEPGIELKKSKLDLSLLENRDAKGKPTMNIDPRTMMLKKSSSAGPVSKKEVVKPKINPNNTIDRAIAKMPKITQPLARTAKPLARLALPGLTRTAREFNKNPLRTIAKKTAQVVSPIAYQGARQIKNIFKRWF